MADRRDYYFRQKVTEAELDAGFEGLEQADFDQIVDQDLVGIVDGMEVSEKSGTPNLTVDVAGPGAAYSKQGERISFSALQNVDLSVDDGAVSTAVAAPGNSRVVSLFIEFDRLLSDPRIDGNSLTVYFQRDESFAFSVVAGAEALTGGEVPPALDPNKILLADITLDFGQTQILNADVDVTRREDAFRITSGTPYALVSQTVKEAVTALLAGINDHVTSGGHDVGAITNAASLIAANVFTNTLNTFRQIALGNNLENNDAERDTARIVHAGPTADGKYVLLGEFTIGGGLGAARLYMGRGSSTPSFVVTLNASYGNAAGLWTRDSAAVPSLKFWWLSTGSQGALQFLYQNTASFADNAWLSDHTLQFAGSGGAFAAFYQGRNARFQVTNVTAGTDTEDSNPDNTVTPTANTLYAKNIPKAWGVILTDGASGVTVEDGFNITASIVANRIRLTFPRAMANANYAIECTARSGQYIHWSSVNEATGTCDLVGVSVSTDSEINANSGILEVSVTVHARQS